MGAPTTDRGGIQQTIRTLRADGWVLSFVYDGGENVKVENEREAVEAIESTGMAHLHVWRADGTPGWVFFVLGSAPDEVICDYTTNLTCLDTLTSGWH